MSTAESGYLELRRYCKSSINCNIIGLLLLFPSLIFPSQAFVSGVKYTVQGDIKLGGLIPVHTYDEKIENCGDIRSINALKKLEAMVYAIRQVNQNAILLPNITLGFEIYDTCSSDARTLRECLNFIPSTGQPTDGCTASSVPKDRLPIVGVVGAQRSASSVQAAILLGLYHIPQISYLSTSDELSNNLRFPYFLRTVGADLYQVKAIVDILLHYDWKYVSFVNSEDTYGRNGRQAFAALASRNNICIGLSQAISRFDGRDSYNNLIKDLLEIQQDYSATVVVLFLHLEMAQRIFSAASEMNAQRRFIWIGSDSWGNYGEEAIMRNEEAAIGSFTVVPASQILPDFNEYFRSLTPSTSNNPWLLEFLKHYTNCTTEEQLLTNPNCNDPGLIGSLDSNTSFHETLVIDSVLAFAHALDSLKQELCPNTGLCQQMASIDGNDLLKHLLKTSFTSPANGHVSFRSNGDVSGRYAIRYLQWSNDSSYTFVPVGKWDEDTDSETVIHQDVPWYLWEGASRQNDTGVPKSVCSEACKQWERKNVDLDNACCWTCSTCYKHEIVVNNNTECQSCIDKAQLIFAWPNENFTDCVPLKTSKNSWEYPILSVAIVGIITTIVIICFYTHNRENILIKASSRELSSIMFVGILISFLSTLFFGVPPTTGVCVMRSLGPPLATSLIYVSLGVKTFRLFRIFRASVKTAKRPKFIRPNSQIALTLSLTVIPLLWTVIWMIVQPPQVVLEMPYENEPYLEISCSRNTLKAIGIMLWNLSIVLLCSILAFLTRKLPENYNETKFIAFCAFCSLVVFMAFSTSNITVPEAYARDGYNSLSLIVNATMTLFCLFFVKLYAIYFVKFEEWNVKRLSTLTQDLPVVTGSRPLSGITIPADVHTGDIPRNTYLTKSNSGLEQQQVNGL